MERIVGSLTAKPKEYATMIQGLRELEINEQAAFYLFLAAMTCRLIMKTPENIVSQWDKKAVTAFSHFYSVNMEKVIIASPRLSTLRKIKESLLMGSALAISLFKAFLPSMDKAKERQDSDTVGLTVVNYVINASTAVKEKSLLAFMKGLWCNGTAHPYPQSIIFLPLTFMGTGSYLDLGGSGQDTSVLTASYLCNPKIIACSYCSAWL